MELFLNPYVTYAIFGVILILLFFFFYSLLHSIQFIQSTKKNLERIYTNLHKRDEDRISRNEKASTKNYDSTKKVGILQKFLMEIDNTIIYSNIKDTIKWLNTSVFVIFVILITAICFIITLTMIKSMILALLISLIPAFCPYIYLKLIALHNYHKTEEQLLTFVDMVSNNSAVSNSLITVLENTADYLDPPISSAIYRAISTVNVTGSNEKGIIQLTREIEHPLFVKFIRNLDICSKNDANYHKIAMDFSNVIDQDLKYIERCRSILSGGRKQILLLWLICAISVVIGSSILGTGIIPMIKEMSNSTIGVFVLALEILLNGFTIIYLIIGMNK